MADLPDIPLIRSMNSVDTYDECHEILVSVRAFRTGVFHPASAPVWNGLLAVSSGDDHIARRRYVAQLFGSPSVARHIDEYLDPAIEEWFTERSGHAGRGPIRGDLIALVRLVTVRLQAAVVGLDGVAESSEAAARLLRYAERFAAAVQARWSTRSPEEMDQLVRDGLDAIEEYDEEFYSPAVRRRETLVASHLAGAVALEDLPDDLIVRQLLPKGRLLWDAATAIRESLGFVNGGIGTTATALASAVDLYLAGSHRRPERESDPDYIRAIVNETLRLRPPSPFILRQAVEDTTLSSGRRFSAGEDIVLLIDRANRDPEAFGADAEEFRPDRYLELDKHPQYGLTFGAGPHLCVGKPLVTVAARDKSETSVQRIMTRVLAACLRAGVVPDSDNHAQRTATYLDSYQTYPVIFTRVAPAVR